jgi:hypothetical protein
MWLTIVSSYKLITRKENNHHNKLIIILIYLTKIKQLTTTKLVSNFKRLFLDMSYYYKSMMRGYSIWERVPVPDTYPYQYQIHSYLNLCPYMYNSFCKNVVTRIDTRIRYRRTGTVPAPRQHSYKYFEKVTNCITPSN